MSERPHFVLVGMMGVGKSSLGRALAADRGFGYVDSDDDITRLFGISGAEYAAEHSVAELHDIEAAVLLGALASNQPAVICAAASVVEREPVREALARRAVVVLLTAELDEILTRQQRGDHRRPMELDELATLWNRRKPLFDLVADVELTADRDPDELVKDLLGRLAPSSPSN